MVAKHDSILTIVLFGGNILQQKELVQKITRLYPNSCYDFVLIANKKDNHDSDLISNIDHPTKIVRVNGRIKSPQFIVSKVLNVCRTNFFLFQDVQEDICNINKFIGTIKNKSRLDSLICMTVPYRRKENYSVEDAPFLFNDKNISNIVFPRILLKQSILAPGQYEWKIQIILKADNIMILPLKNEVIEIQVISGFFETINDHLYKFRNQISKSEMNQYSKTLLIKNFYEQIVSQQIGEFYKKVVFEKNSTNQVEFFMNLEQWIKDIDIQILSKIPAIRYFFIRWTIDHYKFLSYRAKRQHLRVMKYIVDNMHFDSYQIFIKKYNKMFPAAIKAIRFKSMIPIYFYLIHRKVKKKLKNYKEMTIKRQHIEVTR